MTHPDAIRAIPDRVERVKAANAAMVAHHTLISELATITRAVVQEMRDEGMSYADVGMALGVSRSRAQQLAAGY